MKLKPGDIVRWKPGRGSDYTPGPYRVVQLMNHDRYVKLRRLDGATVFFGSRHRYEHNYTEAEDLELDPFLDPAAKAIKCSK